MCPLIDKSHPRCAGRLCLRRLEEALGVCADQYQDCSIYASLRPAKAARVQKVGEVEDAVSPG